MSPLISPDRPPRSTCVAVDGCLDALPRSTKLSSVWVRSASSAWDMAKHPDALLPTIEPKLAPRSTCLAGASNAFVKLNGGAAGSPGSLLAPAEDAGEPATFITSLRSPDAAALEPLRIGCEIIWLCQRLNRDAPD